MSAATLAVFTALIVWHGPAGVAACVLLILSAVFASTAHHVWVTW